MSTPTARDMMHAAESRLIGWNPFKVDIRWYGVLPGSGADIAATITTAASENSEIIFPAGAWVITATPTIPDNVLLTALPGATFSGAGAQALGLISDPAHFHAFITERATISGQTPAQANAGGGLVGPYIFYTAGDTVDTTTLGNANLRNLISHLVAKTGHTGGRSAVMNQVVITGTPNVTPTVGYVGTESLVQCSANLTGAAGAITNYKGGVYGANPLARTVNGGTFLFIVNGQENNVAVRFGGSTAHKHGISLIKTSDDYNQGAYDDSALFICDQEGLTIAGGTIPATGMTAGKTYVIQTVGSTDYTAVGSPTNTIGQFFNATGAGTGTGTVLFEMPAWINGIGLGSYSQKWPFDGNSTLMYAWQRQAGIPVQMSAFAMQAGGGYKINTVGTTNFTLVGSPNNTVGTVFIATGPAAAGTTGTVLRGQTVANIGIDLTQVLFQTAAFQSAGFSVNPIGFISTTPGATNGELIATSAALTTGAGAALGTLANAPAAGNPTKWIKINDNGTIRAVPAW
jgi:hypothetical protein